MKQEEKGSIDQNEVIVNGALMMWVFLRFCPPETSSLTPNSIAGTETTAAFLAGLFNMLCRHPAVLAKLTEEIRRARPDVLLVEEAGEILESHVLTSLGESVSQMILIGDHKYVFSSAYTPFVSDISSF